MGIKRTIKMTAEPSSMELNAAFEEFILEKEARNLSYKSIENYKQSYRLFMEFNEFDNETTTAEIEVKLFYKWANTLKLQGVKHTSINHYLRDCRTFFYWCMDEDRQYITPRFKIEMLEGQEEKPKLFPDEDLLTLLEKPRNNDGYPTWRSWAVVNWVLGTANRAASIVEVKIGDIDFKNRELSIYHTKNKKALTLPLSSSLQTVLKEYIRIWRNGAPKDAYLFCNVGEEKLTTNALQHSFAKYCKDRGVNQTNLHGLRHSFAKQWLQNDGNMFKLQQILGHSTLDMTRRYVKLFNEDLKDDFDKFSPLDNLKKASKRTQTIKRHK